MSADRCPCGDRERSQCPGEWEPGCDLGNNPAHVVVAKQSADRWALVPVTARDNLARWLRLMAETPLDAGYWTNGRFQADCQDALAALAAAPAAPAAEPVCRSDGRCQYAIDSGAEGLGHCPKGKCIMPAAPGAIPAQSREPLTADQKMILWHKESAVHKRNSAFEWYAAGVEASERAHGIGSQP